MSAATLIRELADTGIRLSVNGDKLHIEARSGTITPALRQTLTEHKAKLMALIATRGRLVTVAGSLGLPDSLVQDLPDGELVATAEQLTWYDDTEIQRKLLVFYLRALAGIEPAPPGSIAYGRQHADPVSSMGDNKRVA